MGELETRHPTILSVKVPEGKNGVLIGRGGAHITPIKEATKCSAQNLGNGNLWIIEGPSVAAVSEFIRLAKALMEREQVIGTTGRVVKALEPIVVRDGTRGAAKKTSKPKVSAKKPASRRSVSAIPANKSSTRKADTQKPSATREKKKPSMLSRIFKLFE